MTKWKIVADSGCDYKELANLAPDTLFQSVPLSIQIEGTDYVDDTNLDIDYMMNAMYGSSKAATSACPSPQAYAAAYEGAENIIVVSLTGTLSGSFQQR